MSVIVIVGILIAACGMYLSLAERSSAHDAPIKKTPADDTSPTRSVIPRSMIYQGAIFVGLAILGISNASAPESLSRSILADGVRGTVFYLGACLAVVGAVGVVFSSTVRSVALSAAILGTGGATVLGVSGNAVVGGILLIGAALCGWWLHSTAQRPVSPVAQSPNKNADQSSAIDRAMAENVHPVAEPLLTSVAVVLLCWILTSTLQSAVQEGAGSTKTMSGSSRALPRPAFAPTRVSDRQPNTDNVESKFAPSPKENALFWCAAGLLAATVGLGYSRSDKNKGCSVSSDTEQ